MQLLQRNLACCIQMKNMVQQRQRFFLTRSYYSASLAEFFDFEGVGKAQSHAMLYFSFLLSVNLQEFEAIHFHLVVMGYCFSHFEVKQEFNQFWNKTVT